MTTKLIEHAYDRWLPTGQVRVEIDAVTAEKLQSPVSGHLEHQHLHFELMPRRPCGRTCDCVNRDVLPCVS
jgi:hypothetical protein